MGESIPKGLRVKEWTEDLEFPSDDPLTRAIVEKWDASFHLLDYRCDSNLLDVILLYFLLEPFSNGLLHL